jgi:hypothetical protein
MNRKMIGEAIYIREIPLSFNDIDNFAVVVQRQSVIHTENSGFASPTLGQHISTFRGYRILFSIIKISV